MTDQGTADLSQDERDILRVIGRSWGWVLFFGIVTLILGAVVLARPRDTVFAFAIVFGIWLFVAGLFRIVMAFAESGETGGERLLMVLLGLLAVFIGILFLRRTEDTVTTLAFLLGLFWVIGGIIEFVHAYGDGGSPARSWRMAIGVLAFAAGIVTLVVPHLTLTTLAVIMGIWLVIYGVFQITVSFLVRKLAAI